MSLFCLLWTPLFYLFWRCFDREGPGGGVVFALILGAVVALARFFLGNLVNPGGFGLSRWIAAWVDVIVLPVALPLTAALLCRLFYLFSQTVVPTNFTLLYLIPVAALRAVSWSAENDPTFLVLAPLLWTSMAVGMPFLAGLMSRSFRWYSRLLALGGLFVLPFISATAWWAFSSQRYFLGGPLLLLAASPVLAAFIMERN